MSKVAEAIAVEATAEDTDPAPKRLDAPLPTVADSDELWLDAT
jgi:hypothetical protein